MKKYLLIFYIFSLAIGQGLKNDVALSPVVTYWKTLSIEEKDQFGNVSASYSSLENQNEVRWSDSDGNLYVQIDKHDYLFFYCGD